MAGRQHGFVTRTQVLGLGVSDRAITARLHAGKLTAVHAGVYAVGAVPVDPVSLAHAAVLACGPDAVLSHASAAALWGLGRWPRRPEVTAAHERRRPRLVTHRSTTLSAHDITVNYGIPVTTVLRTVIDISPRLTDRQLTRAVNNARLAGHLKPTALHELLRRCSRARRLIDPAQNATRSPAEDDFLAWINRHRLPVPAMNFRRNGREIDAVFAAAKVIVELDGWNFHNDYASFRSDRTRDRANAAIGYLTLRYTPEDLTDEEAERLREILLTRSSAC